MFHSKDGTCDLQTHNNVNNYYLRNSSNHESGILDDTLHAVEIQQIIDTRKLSKQHKLATEATRKSMTVHAINSTVDHQHSII